ncbi:MAG: hypothetical protein Q3983_07775 [Capnocytophaga sp.]|nr:hypothetical protein [Capnocytophaga sp.]
MKINEVPQQKGALGSLKELYYATDQNGNYTTVLSAGWEVKDTALQASLSHIEEQLEEAKRQIIAKEKSPIVFFMIKNRMDWNILAGYMNSWVFWIKRHAKPSVFNKLSAKTLQKYADIFEISVEELKNPTLH